MVLHWLRSRIPPISATELGVFRVFFGCALAWVIYELRLSPAPFPIELHLRSHGLADWDWVHALAVRPDLVARLEWIIIGLALVFAAGIWTRTAFAALVVAATAWTLVRLTHTGTHNWSPLFVTLWALLPVRWGDGVSVDAWRRRRRVAPGERRTQYGYALWVPGLLFGTAMAGAGLAKLVNAGLAWITNGSVKYHFVVDAANAPTNWGLWVATRHDVAVALSAGAVIVESTLVLAVLIPSYWGRLPFALGGLGLLGGFYVFQGEIWLSWWLLFLAFFVPWPPLVRAVMRRERTRPVEACPWVSWPQVAAIAIVCALQIAATVLRVEHAPVMSDYPMYSSTYASIAEFERHRPAETTYHFAVRFRDDTERFATDTFDRLELFGPVRDAYARIRDAGDPDAAASEVQTIVQTVARRLHEHYEEPVAAIIVLIDERGFDWQTGRFVWRSIRKPVYTFHVRP